ncbi:UNVERIFIED_CONTAM: hypothetical protein ODX46_17025, partial [Salmonella enterica subsp. enterica serovar Enteritidis]
RRFHPDDNPPGPGVKIDIIDADTGAADDLQDGGGGNQLYRDLGGRTDGKTVILADHFGQLFLVLAEIRQVIDLYATILEDLNGGRGEFIGYEYARCHQGLHR